MRKQYIKMMFHTHFTVAALVLLLIYAILPCLDQGLLSIVFDAALPLKNSSWFLQNYLYTFSSPVVTFFIVPIYAIYIQCNHLFFQKEDVIVRFESLYTYWRTRIFYLFLHTVVFVLLNYGLLVFRLAFYGKIMKLAGNGTSLLFCIPLNILGFMVFGLILEFAGAFIGNSGWSFFISYFLVLYDYFADRILWVGIYVDRAFAFIPGPVLPELQNLCYMAVMCILLLIVFPMILSNRDCLIPQERRNAS